MRKPAISSSLGILALVLAASAAGAQESALNRVTDGGFESGLVNLSLPTDVPFPVFSGGWAWRGTRPPTFPAAGPYDGDLSVRIDSRPRDPVQAIQDLPLNGAAYRLSFAFLIEGGTQSVRLLNDWDRGAPEIATPAFEARLSSTAIRFTTAAGSWQMSVAIDPGTWHSLSVIADPRNGTQSVRLDDRPLLSLPGLSFLHRSTLVLGGGTAERGVFRYDGVELTSLVDLELATTGELVAQLDVPSRAAVFVRLAAAHAAVERGSAALALAELGVARNLLSRSAPATGGVIRAIGELMELIAIGGAEGEAGPLPSTW